MTAKAIAALEQSFDKYSLVDCSGWLDEARAVKDDAEIALMTRCAEICVEQYELQVKALPEKRWREYELALHGWDTSSTVAPRRSVTPTSTRRSAKGCS